MTTAIREHRRIAVPEQAIAAYHRDGAVLLKGLLSDVELDLLRDGLEEIEAAPGAMSSRVEGRDGTGETLVDQFPSHSSPSLRKLIEEGISAQLAATLMGTSSAQLILDQVFYKRAGRIVPTPWHQDTPFLRVRGHDMARVWLTCDPSPHDVTLSVVRGSHLWNVVFNTGSMAESEVRTAAEAGEFTYDGIGDERLPPVPDIEGHRDSFDILSWDVEPGDVIVFHGNILHGTSGKEHHPHPRRAFASMWGGPALRYQAAMPHAMPLPTGAAPGAIPHGVRIGGHPDVFPVYWASSP